MLCLAPRISDAYLECLRQVQCEDKPYSIVSGNLGLAWLHAISQTVQNIHIFDLDPGVLRYNKALVMLLQNSRSLEEFVEFLSGYRVQELSPLLFSSDKIGFARVWSILKDPELYGMYCATIGHMVFDRASSSARLGDSRILFTNHSLAPMHYSWRIGDSVFSSEEAFRRLQGALHRAQIFFHRAPLHDVSWGNMVKSIPTVLLGGNTDSPLYLRGDPFMQTILQTDANTIRFISWKRDIVVPPAEEEMESYILDRISCGDAYSLGYINPHCISILTLKDLQSQRLFCRNLIVIDIDGLNPEDISNEAFFDSIVPTFKSVIITGQDTGAVLLGRAAERGLFRSCTIEVFMQRGGRFLLHIKLRGVRV